MTNITREAPSEEGDSFTRFSRSYNLCKYPKYGDSAGKGVTGGAIESNVPRKQTVSPETPRTVKISQSYFPPEPPSYAPYHIHYTPRARRRSGSGIDYHKENPHFFPMTSGTGTTNSQLNRSNGCWEPGKPSDSFHSILGPAPEFAAKPSAIASEHAGKFNELDELNELQSDITSWGLNHDCMAFAQIEPTNCIELCQFIRDHPWILREKTSNFRTAAIRAYRHGQDDCGDRMVQATALLLGFQERKLGTLGAIGYVRELHSGRLDLERIPFGLYDILEDVPQRSQYIQHMRQVEVLRQMCKSLSADQKADDLATFCVDPPKTPRSIHSSDRELANVMSLPVRSVSSSPKEISNRSAPLKRNFEYSSQPPESPRITIGATSELLKKDHLPISNRGESLSEHQDASALPHTDRHNGRRRHLKQQHDQLTGQLVFPPVRSLNRYTVASALKQFYFLCKEGNGLIRAVLDESINSSDDFLPKVSETSEIARGFANRTAGEKPQEKFKEKFRHPYGQCITCDILGFHFEQPHPGSVVLNGDGNNETLVIPKQNGDTARKRKLTTIKAPSLSSFSSDQDKGDVNIATKKPKQRNVVRTEFPCWWYVKDPIRFSACEFYCSRDRDLNSYRRHHFDDHWRWGDVLADGITFDTWNNAKHAKCKQTSITPQERAKSKWMLSFRILFGLSEADEISDPECSDRHHIYCRPKRPIRTALQASIQENVEPEDHQTENSLNALQTSSSSREVVHPEPAFLGPQPPEMPPFFFPDLNASELVDPDLPNFENTWDNRLLIANDLLHMNQHTGNRLSSLIESHICRIEGLLCDMRTRPETMSRDLIHQICHFAVDLEQNYTQAILDSNQVLSQTCRNRTTTAATDPSLPATRPNNVIPRRVDTRLGRQASAWPVSNPCSNSNLDTFDGHSSPRSQSNERASDTEQPHMPPTPTLTNETHKMLTQGAGQKALNNKRVSILDNESSEIPIYPLIDEAWFDT